MNLKDKQYILYLISNDKYKLTVMIFNKLVIIHFWIKAQMTYVLYWKTLDHFLLCFALDVFM